MQQTILTPTTIVATFGKQIILTTIGSNWSLQFSGILARLTPGFGIGWVKPNNTVLFLGIPDASGNLECDGADGPIDPHMTFQFKTNVEPVDASKPAPCPGMFLPFGSNDVTYCLAAPAPPPLPPGLVKMQADLMSGALICDPPRQAVEANYSLSFMPAGNLAGFVQGYAALGASQTEVLAAELGAAVFQAFPPPDFTPSAVTGTIPDVAWLRWLDNDPGSPNVGKMVSACAGHLNSVANCGAHTLADLRACCTTNIHSNG